MLIYAGTREILQDDARLVAGKARDAGGEVTLRIIESMPHVFTTMTGVFAEADKAMEEIGRFFMRHLSISTGE
jgi:acetyl esterase/lipase